MDREDFFRLKKVQGKKKRDQAERDILDKANQQKQDAADQAEADALAGGGEVPKKKAVDEEESGDLLGGKDEDVIF
jgi:V-type H+-transporting ATPase subunit D